MCRDFSSGESLGFGYVNFNNIEEAERALNNENYKQLNNKEFRLMWQIKDSKLVSKFNVIVKNLPKDILSSALSSLFSEAGNIFSCKIPLNSKSNSEGFGFVCFYDEESVTNAIEKFNDFDYKGKIIKVEKYDKKHSDSKEAPFNNL